MSDNNLDKLSAPERLDFERLKWACRRGMLELDVLLGNFLQLKYLSLSSEMQMNFKLLLKESDPELFSWLLGEREPAPQYTALIQLIREINHRVV